MRKNDEFLRHSGFDGWRYDLWAVAATAGTAVLAYITFRHGIAAVLRNPFSFLLLIIALMVVVTVWHGRPDKQA